MPRVKKIIQARDGGPIPVAYSEVEVGGETVLAPVVVLEAGAQVQLSGSIPVDEAAETVAVSSTAVGLTTVPASANGALVTVEDAEVRFWVDGSTPTAAAGHLAGPGDTIELTTRAELLGFKAIRVSDNAKLQVTYLVGAP